MNIETIARGSFSGHETFPFRFAWLPRGVQALAQDPELFSREDAIIRLGVGKNMVRSIHHWGTAAGLLADVPGSRGRMSRATPLGGQLLGSDGWDPYLEDPGTLWLLHWELASKPLPATTWYWAFNHAPQMEFTRGQLVGWLTRLAEHRGWARISPASLKRDVDTFVRTYVASRTGRGIGVEDAIDCPLVELGLLRETADRASLMLQRGRHPSLPDAIFTYALIRQLERLGREHGTVPLHDVAFAAGAPGRVFVLTEDALLVRLERVAALTKDAIVYDDTAGLRQLLVKRPFEPLMLLKNYYSKSGGRA
jgi:hypothetical protein